jgi:prevent-host-death family protein
MKPSTAVRPISYLKAHASELIREIARTRQALVITQNGEAKVVMQDIRSYEQTQETLALLKILAVSRENIRRGKSRPMDATFGRLEKRIAAHRNESA